MAKKQISEYKIAKNKTGGGPSPKPLPDLIQRIWDLIPNQFERISNEFDDDESINEEIIKVTIPKPNSFLPHTTPTISTPSDAHPDEDNMLVMPSSSKKRKLL